MRYPSVVGGWFFRSHVAGQNSASRANRSAWLAFAHVCILAKLASRRSVLDGLESTLAAPAQQPDLQSARDLSIAGMHVQYGNAPD